MFYNRRNELKRLNGRFNSEQAELLIVYGRRRVGKTVLLQQFVIDKPHIYFLADFSSEKEQLTQFSERIRQFSHDSALLDNPFTNWNALFAYLKQLSIKERLIVIIDEYPYLQSSNRAITSIIQKVWDENLKDSSVFFVLCGSYVSFMENELLAYKSPLYGRRTGQFFIEPLHFYQAKDFFQGYSLVDTVRAFGILGGIPAYLRQFNVKKTIEENIENAFLFSDSYLFNEARFLLMEELREPRNYFSILKAIAFGATRINEIVQRSGLDRGVVVKYLDVLRNLRIVNREIPVTEKHPEKSRKGIYRIQDNYFQFWFRFIMPNQSYIAENQQKMLLKNQIMPYLDQFLGKAFEQICITFLKQVNFKNKLPFQIHKIGNFWKGNTEIDIVAFDANNENVLLAECKWSSKRVGTNILDDLIRKTSILQQEISGKNIYYALFSRSGFTPDLVELNRPDLLKFELKDLEDSEYDHKTKL